MSLPTQRPMPSQRRTVTALAQALPLRMSPLLLLAPRVTSDRAFCGPIGYRPIRRRRAAALSCSASLGHGALTALELNDPLNHSTMQFFLLAFNVQFFQNGSEWPGPCDAKMRVKECIPTFEQNETAVSGHEIHRTLALLDLFEHMQNNNICSI